MDTTTYKNFEDYLKEVHSVDYAEGVLDDDMQDSYERWLEQLSIEEIIRFADDYAKAVKF